MTNITPRRRKYHYPKERRDAFNAAMAHDITDAAHFRFLVMRLTDAPKEIAFALAGCKTLDDWRSVLSEMEAKGE